jgi:hypothetical protein
VRVKESACGVRCDRTTGEPRTGTAGPAGSPADAASTWPPRTSTAFGPAVYRPRVPALVTHSSRPPEETALLPPHLRVLSLGAGVQSTTVLLMALSGELPDRLDCAIFADTGWEPAGVYRHLAWLEEQAELGGIPVHRVSAGNLKQDLLDAVAAKKPRVANPPFYVKNADPDREYDKPDKGGMLWRKCTKHYKVDVIRRKTRALALRKYGSSRLPAGFVEQWFGISFDELTQMRTSDVAYIRNSYPLVDRRITRAGCLAWLKARGYPVPPKSACLGCPYHHNALWSEMKRERPEEWAETVAFDRVIRRGLPGVKGEAFVHRSMIPLDLVDLRTNAEKGQPTLPGLGWEEECSGHCGV